MSAAGGGAGAARTLTQQSLPGGGRSGGPGGGPRVSGSNMYSGAGSSSHRGSRAGSQARGSVTSLQSAVGPRLASLPGAASGPRWGGVQPSASASTGALLGGSALLFGSEGAGGSPTGDATDSDLPSSYYSARQSIWAPPSSSAAASVGGDGRGSGLLSGIPRSRPAASPSGDLAQAPSLRRGWGNGPAGGAAPSPQPQPSQAQPQPQGPGKFLKMGGFLSFLRRKNAEDEQPPPPAPRPAHQARDNGRRLVPSSSASSGGLLTGGGDADGEEPAVPSLSLVMTAVTTGQFDTSAGSETHRAQMAPMPPTTARAGGGRPRSKTVPADLAAASETATAAAAAVSKAPTVPVAPAAMVPPGGPGTSSDHPGPPEKKRFGKGLFSSFRFRKGPAAAAAAPPSPATAGKSPVAAPPSSSVASVLPPIRQPRVAGAASVSPRGRSSL